MVVSQVYRCRSIGTCLSLVVGRFHVIWTMERELVIRIGVVPR
jgi:hypothetical protein